MARARRPEYDSQEFRDRWHSDEELKSLSKWLGVSASAVSKAASVRGFRPRYWRERDALTFRTCRKAS